MLEYYPNQNSTKYVTVYITFYYIIFIHFFINFYFSNLEEDCMYSVTGDKPGLRMKSHPRRKICPQI